MKYTGSSLHQGYADKMITIDLGSRAITTPALDATLRRYFLGGRALGLYLLHRPSRPGRLPVIRKIP